MQRCTRFIERGVLKLRSFGSGVEGNETADDLARIASDTPLLGPEPSIPVSLPALYSFINEWITKTFKGKWNEAPIARQANNCIGINPRYSEYFLSLNRKNLKRLTDILTGHCSLNYHLKSLGLRD